MKKNTIFYINPQSKGSLAIYDYSLLNRVLGSEIHYFCNKAYDYKAITSVIYNRTFDYTQQTNKIFKLMSYFISMICVFVAAVKIKPDKIHIQWIRVFIIDYLIYWLIKKITRCQIVYTVHNILPHNHKKSDKSKYSKIYNLADALIVHTEKSKQELIQNFNILPKKIYVVQHGPIKFEIEQSQLQSEKKKLISQYGLEDKIIFSSLGIQSHYKGTDLLYNSWQNNSKLSENKDIVCIIAGLQDSSVCLNESCKSDNIILINRKLENIEFQALVELTDVALLPYREISQSGVLLSYIDQSIPYCATNVGELLKPLSLGNVAWSFDSCSETDIAKKIIEIANDKMSIVNRKNDAEGWAKVRNFYSWEEAAKITTCIYNM